MSSSVAGHHHHLLHHGPLALVAGNLPAVVAGLPDGVAVVVHGGVVLPAGLPAGLQGLAVVLVVVVGLLAAVVAVGGAVGAAVVGGGGAAADLSALAAGAARRALPLLPRLRVLHAGGYSTGLCR